MQTEKAKLLGYKPEDIRVVAAKFEYTNLRKMYAWVGFIFLGYVVYAGISWLVWANQLINASL